MGLTSSSRVVSARAGLRHTWLHNNPPEPAPTQHLTYLIQRWHSLVQATAESVIEKFEVNDLRGETKGHDLPASRSRKAAVAYQDWLNREPVLAKLCETLDPPTLPH